MSGRGIRRSQMGIQVTMMGTPKVSVDGRELVFPYRKAEGLFY